MMAETTVATGGNPLEQLAPHIVERVIAGDLAALTDADRRLYYEAVCRSIGLNPLTHPFDYITLNGKLRLYSLREATDQLRRVHGISIYISNREVTRDIYVVTARAKDRTGREDEGTGAVYIGNLKGDALANALMRAETKAKRRITLSIAGLGWLDETEVDTIADVKPSLREASPTVGESFIEEEHPTADQISALVELARAGGVDPARFGNHMRQLMHLADETQVTKKFLRESMTMEQFMLAWQYYNELLKKRVEEDLSDDQDLGEDDIKDGDLAGELQDETSGAPEVVDSHTNDTTNLGHSRAPEMEDGDPGVDHDQPEAFRHLEVDAEGFVVEERMSRLIQHGQQHNGMPILRRAKVTGKAKILPSQYIALWREISPDVAGI